MPADCILLESKDLVVDEHVYANGQELIKKKNVANEKNYDEKRDCFLLAKSDIVSGEGKAVVCCVGEARQIYK